MHIGQKVNIGRISKIVNFHLNDLKFEEDLYFRSLNSTSQLFFFGQICFMDFASIVLYTTSSSCLFVCLVVRLCAGYLKKLWTDLDETWWVSWLGVKNKPIKF